MAPGVEVDTGFQGCISEVSGWVCRGVDTGYTVLVIYQISSFHIYLSIATPDGII